MRTLNDYFLHGGSMSAIQTADNASGIAVVPDGGKWEAVYINVHTVIGTLTTFDLLVNNVDSLVDVTLPNGTADETGVVMNVPTEVFVNPGDAISIRSNGEQAAATLADVGFIIRR